MFYVACVMRTVCCICRRVQCICLNECWRRVHCDIEHQQITSHIHWRFHINTIAAEVHLNGVALWVGRSGCVSVRAGCVCEQKQITTRSVSTISIWFEVKWVSVRLYITYICHRQSYLLLSSLLIVDSISLIHPETIEWVVTRSRRSRNTIPNTIDR